jgi:hypothetical protein
VTNLAFSEGLKDFDDIRRHADVHEHLGPTIQKLTNTKQYKQYKINNFTFAVKRF